MSEDNTPAETKQTFEQQVVESANKAVRGEDGKIQFAEGTSEAEQFGVTAEIRRRDTQSEYSKGQSRIKELEAQNDALSNNMLSSVTPDLSDEQTKELADLKATDPDEWYTKRQKYETAARTLVKKEQKELSDKAGREATLSDRDALLTKFHTDNPEIKLTDDFIANELPAGYSNQLAKGKITFEDFLTKSLAYINKTKVIAKGDTPTKEPNLSKVGGRSTPSADAVNSAVSEEYEKTIF